MILLKSVAHSLEMYGDISAGRRLQGAELCQIHFSFAKSSAFAVDVIGLH